MRDLNEILGYCIRVNGITAFYPLFNETSSRPLNPDPAWTKRYGWNNGVVAFVTEDGSYYVTPYCVEVAEVLRALGYVDSGIYVPFSNGDVPSDPALAQQWEGLWQEARKQRAVREERERQDRYAKLAEERRIRELPANVYELSLEIPADGLETSWMGEISKTYPISEDTVMKSMGTYCYNNGRLSFINEKGVMYVTPYTSEVGEALREAGYEERGLYVPLSNGETCTDPAMAEKWDIMDKDAREKLEARIEKERKAHYKKIAESRGVTDLPADAYSLSVEVPKEGLETTRYGEEEVTYPENDWEMPECIGVYCQNNGIVAFVDSEGRKYVTPFVREIREILSAAGYREGGLYVPLSNGEVMTDPQLATKWEVMWRRARGLSEQQTQDFGTPQL